MPSSNLTPEQWLLTRFGDWEAVRDLHIEKPSLTMEQAAEILAELSGKELLNLETGIVAQINSRQANKLISGAAADKSAANGFTFGQHNAAAAKIAVLWKYASLVSEGPDRSGDPNIQSIKRFVVPISLCGETRVAWILAKESVEHGHRIYTLELQEIKTLRGTLDTLESNTEKRTPARSVGQNLSSLEQNVNPEGGGKK